jgi:hypothetical protein
LNTHNVIGKCSNLRMTKEDAPVPLVSLYCTFDSHTPIHWARCPLYSVMVETLSALARRSRSGRDRTDALPRTYFVLRLGCKELLIETELLLVVIAILLFSAGLGNTQPAIFRSVHSSISDGHIHTSHFRHTLFSSIFRIHQTLDIRLCNISRPLAALSRLTFYCPLILNFSFILSFHGPVKDSFHSSV